MSERTMLEKIRALATAEAAKGNGLVALWVNWNRYRHRPASFTMELGASSRREEVAAALNSLWNDQGIAAVIHRGSMVRADLAADRTAWLVEELASRIGGTDLAGFADHLAAGGRSRCGAVVVLSDQDFAHDGQSYMDFVHGGNRHRVVVVDPDEALPSGLASLLAYDSEIQRMVSLLEARLVDRWLAGESRDAAAMKQALNQLCLTFCSQRDPAQARRLAGLSPGPGGSAPLTTEEQAAILEGMRRDLTTPVEVIEDKRLGDRVDGLLNWFLPRDGKVSLSSGRLFLRCFGAPVVERLTPDSWGVSLMNNASSRDRGDLRDDPALEVAVLTLHSLYCAMRLSNMFAHRGEYVFDLPAYVLEGMLRNEVRNLERVANAWDA